MAVSELYYGGIAEDGKHLMTYLLDADADVASIPAAATVGSEALLADGTKKWVKAPNGTWTQNS